MIAVRCLLPKASVTALEMCLAGADIDVRLRSEQVLLGWIIVTSRLCVIKLNIIKTLEDKDTSVLLCRFCRCLTNCSSFGVKGEFY